MARQDYPAARSRALPAQRYFDSEQYGRWQSSGLVTATDADALLIVFSGAPDALDFNVTGNAAVFTLSDRLGRDAETILVDAFTSYSSHITAERILVRNATAGSVAKVCAIGKWAEEPERSRGY